MNAPNSNWKDGGGDRDWLDLLSPDGDELNRLAIEEIGRRARLGNPVSALDCDCGHGGQALRMAQAGAQVLATDREDLRAAVADAARALDVGDRLRFMQTPALCAGDTGPLPGAPFDLAICHRSLPGLRYTEAVVFVRRILLMLKTGGKLFLSAYGIHSELSEDYPDREKLVKERFSPLSPGIAERYGIAVPVCLYSERDLFMLMFDAGASVLTTFTTTHGNVKAVGVRI